jgi:hypothetical protein
MKGGNELAYAKLCRYECGTQLLGFDEVERKYKEHPSGILHTKERCTEAKNKAGNQPKQQPQQQQNKQQTSFATDQEQRSQDIKAAQLERKRQHIEFIKNLQWNTKIQALRAEQDGGHGTAAEILDAMGFEEFREEQRQEGYDDL